MKVSIASGFKSIKDKSRDDVNVFFFDENYIQEFKYGNIKIKNVDISSSDIKYFTADHGEVIFTNGTNILCGLGDIEKLDPESLRNCAASAVLFAISKKVEGISVTIPVLKKISDTETLKYIAEGTCLANYRFNKYRSENKNVEKPIKRICFITSAKDAAKVINEVEILSLNTFLCRDMINDTSYDINPVSFAETAKRISDKAKMKCTILDKKNISKNNMGLLLAVNSGSSIEPRVVIIEYNGAKGNRGNIGLVGKGITFDSGGMNLKPSGSMETMRCDMSGAATMLFIMKSLAELKVKQNVTAVIPLTENMLSNNAYRPGDIFRSYNGKTVEIGNTDAEGRLILADAISYMEKNFEPDIIIDMATLTGACVVTFGETVAAYLSTDDRLSSAIESASTLTGEKLWRLPFFDDYEDRMKSEIADLSNMSSEKNAGTISGAVFLKKFIEKTPWLHIDIAGTAWYSKARGYRPKNATGYGLRLLVNFIENWRQE